MADSNKLMLALADGIKMKGEHIAKPNPFHSTLDSNPNQGNASGPLDSHGSTPSTTTTTTTTANNSFDFTFTTAFRTPCATASDPKPNEGWGRQTTGLFNNGSSLDSSTGGIPYGEHANTPIPPFINTDTSPPPVSSWLLEPEKLKHFRDLQTMALGNARLLYGSDRNRFFDVNVAFHTSHAKWVALLTIALDGQSKILRTEIGDEPLRSVAVLVDGLHRDTGLLFSKYGAGDVLDGPQGVRDEGGVFRLDERVSVKGREGADDDLSSMGATRGAPAGPRYGWRRGREVRGGAEKRLRGSYED